MQCEKHGFDYDDPLNHTRKKKTTKERAVLIVTTAKTELCCPSKIQGGYSASLKHQVLFTYFNGLL